MGFVRREKLTLRQLLGSLDGARGHFTVAGTPEQIADLIEDWFMDRAADAFNVMPPLLPEMLDVFSAEVIPLLRQRGLFRTTRRFFCINSCVIFGGVFDCLHTPR